MDYLEKLIKKIWKDPVGSSLISALIIALLTTLYNLIISLIFDKDFSAAILGFWNFKVQLWVIVSFLLLFVILIKLLRKRKDKKDTGYQYDNDTLNLDKEMYKRLTESLLNQEIVLDLKNFIFSNESFHLDKLDWISKILNESKRSDFDFFNPEIESLKQGLIKEIEKLQAVLSQNIFSAGPNGWVGIPKEWDRDRYYKASNKIGDCEKAVSEQYDKIVKMSRAILKV